MDRRPIGVFDSGVGGLTVVAGIREFLPHESIVYLGDTARVPYGTRSNETITQFSLEMAAALLEKDVKALVVACNTISAVCLADAQNLAGDIPVIGVIRPTVEAAVLESAGKKIGVIATPATIKSGAYQDAAVALHAKVQIRAKAAPLLVPIIEEGLFDHEVARLMIKEYLQDMRGSVDTLILGCTHYPLIRTAVAEFMGSATRVVDSAKPTAKALEKLLDERGLRSNASRPTQVYFTSDNPSKSQEIATVFLGEELELKKLVL